jgi:hypothetical protein
VISDVYLSQIGSEHISDRRTSGRTARRNSPDDQTGSFYPFSREFFQDMLARLSGPGRFRFILQPVVAILLGARDGVKDARAGSPPFLWGLLFHPEHRNRLVRSAFASVNGIVCVAILLDVISQLLIFHRVNPVRPYCTVQF